MADDLEDYLNDEEDEEDAAPAPSDDRGNSNAFAQLRQQLRAEKKARKAAEDRAAALEPVAQQVRLTNAQAALKAAGLPEQMAATFLKVHDGDVTEDAARAFAQANGLAAVSEEEQAPQTFVPTVGGDAPGPKKVSWDEAMSLLTNPSTKDAALKMFDEGRVESR